MFKCKRCGKAFDTFNQVRSHLRAHSNKKSGAQYKGVINKATVQKVKKRGRRKLGQQSPTKSKEEWQHSSNIFQGLNKMREESDKQNYLEMKSQYEAGDSIHMNAQLQTQENTVQDSSGKKRQHNVVISNAKRVQKVRKGRLIKKTYKKKLGMSTMGRRRTCKVCRKVFPSHLSLHGHMKVHGQQSYHRCKSCSLMFTRIDLFKKHFKKHPDHEAGESGRMDAAWVKSHMSEQVKEHTRQAGGKVTKENEPKQRTKRKYVRKNSIKEGSLEVKTNFTNVNLRETNRVVNTKEAALCNKTHNDLVHTSQTDSVYNEYLEQSPVSSDSDNDPLSSLARKELKTSELNISQSSSCSSSYIDTERHQQEEDPMMQNGVKNLSGKYDSRQESRAPSTVSDPSTVEYTDVNQDQSPGDDLCPYMSDDEEVFSDGFIQGEVLDLSCPKGNSLPDNCKEVDIGVRESPVDCLPHESYQALDHPQVIVPQPQYPRPSRGFFRPEGKLPSLGGAFQPLPGPIRPIDMTFHSSNMPKDVANKVENLNVSSPKEIGEETNEISTKFPSIASSNPKETKVMFNLYSKLN